MDKQLLNLLYQDDNIIAVYQSGEMVDQYSDLDLIVVVQYVHAFNYLEYTKLLGHIVMYQNPQTCYLDKINEYDLNKHMSHLVIYEKLRVDFQVFTLDSLQLESIANLKFSKVSNIIENPNPDYRDFVIRNLNQTIFNNYCNELYWTIISLARYYQRLDISVIINFIGDVVRPPLNQIIEWYLLVGFNVNYRSKYMKGIEKYLTDDEDQLYRYFIKGDGHVIEMLNFINKMCQTIATEQYITYNSYEYDAAIKYIKQLLSK